MSSTYSQAVLAGLRLSGLSAAQVRRTVGAPLTVLQAIFTGRRELTDSQVKRIEMLTQQKIDRLAASGLEPGDGPLPDLIKARNHAMKLRKQALAAAAGPAKSKASTRRKRSVRRQRRVRV
jgi:hypothetical protein